MTTIEKLQSMLVNSGMFESQAKEVMHIAIPVINDLVADYQISLNRPSSEYPDVIYNILFLAIKPIALKWIEENLPLAWYKPIFE